MGEARTPIPTLAGGLTITEFLREGRAPNDSEDGTGVAGRLRVDGKFFARGGERVRLQGVTYGPFAPGEGGDPFPTQARVDDDFAAMRAAGVNAIRTYHAPPAWLLSRADELGVGVLVEAPWPKHLCFLDSARPRATRRRAVREVVAAAGHPCVTAYSVGNEVLPSVALAWCRPCRAFSPRIDGRYRQADPDGLATMPPPAH